ncbi:MAG: hypothetical protein KDB00_17265 [Planctomycetales bacterium]|nr:hypothetical protein [Planctomycetales bacterium]
MNRIVSTVKIVVALFVLMAISGCGSSNRSDDDTQSTQTAASPDGVPKMAAEDYLRQVLSRYRNAKSYRDQAEVRLVVEKDGQVTRRTAPMHVAIDGSTIWLAAYDARLWSDAGKTIGWIADPDSDFHDSQVVVGGSSASAASSIRPVLEHLLRDPILASRMVSGLGGPPPQLEWLLDPDPMAKLFRRDRGQTESAGSQDETPTIQYEGMAMRDQVQCVVIRAIAENDTYRFWIEESRSMIKGVELPVSMAGKQINLDGWTVLSLELSLNGASFETPAKPYQMADMPAAELPANPKYVRALVPLPPPQPDRRIGSRIESFKRLTIDRPLSLWYAGFADRDDHAEARNLQAINTLSSWLAQTAETTRNRVRPIGIVDEGNKRILESAGVKSTDWILMPDDDGALSRRIGIESGQAALVDSGGQIIWVGAAISPADLVSLDAVAADTVAGVNVPDRIRRAWEADRDAYRKKISELLVR